MRRAGAAPGVRCRTPPIPLRFFTLRPAAGRAGGRRAQNFYNEGTLIWLEADVTIRPSHRRQEDARRDFCTLFHSQNDNGPNRSG